jgi:hypothetical protein
VLPRFFFLLWITLHAATSLAEQPVFDMMPRWDNGWGMQLEHEYESHSDAVGHLLHLEGVYTWRRWIRVTYKIPWVLTEQSLTDPALPPDSGIGTPVLALPLKKYFNKDGRSGSWSLTPHVFLPVSTTLLGRKDEYGGLSVGYSQETYRTTVGVSVAGHVRHEALMPEWHLNLAGGGKFYGWDSVGNFRLKVDARYRANGDHALRLGPIAYWRLSDRWHVQASWKRSLVAQGFDDGDWIRSGIGMVF